MPSICLFLPKPWQACCHLAHAGTLSMQGSRVHVRDLDGFSCTPLVQTRIRQAGDVGSFVRKKQRDLSRPCFRRLRASCTDAKQGPQECFKASDWYA